MSGFPHGAFVAIHAAQEKRRRDKQEEEEMTKYSTEDLDNNWEFKIVRSETGAFRKPQNFETLLQEEHMAGWELVEKLDDRRVRFKRRKEARRKDAMLPKGYDPYRTRFESSRTRLSVLIGISIALALTVGLVVTGILTGEGGEGIRNFLSIMPPAIVSVIVGLMLVTIIIRRRQ
jgi:hypothetical protein